MERVRSCGFDGLTLGLWPTVPGPYVFDCALGPLCDALPGSSGALGVGGAEGAVVGEPAAEGAPAPGLAEPPELPELLCAIAAPPDNSKAASIAAHVTFIVISLSP